MTGEARPLLGSGTLTLEDVVQVARERVRVASLADSAAGTAALERLERSAAWVDERMRMIEQGRSAKRHVDPVYGINTGFGSLAGRQAFSDPRLATELSRRLIESTACGVGPYLDEDVVRAAMLILANGLSRGYSGVRIQVVDTLVDMLNSDVYPAIPSLGSLGASGDLAPLSHLALVLSRPPAREDVDRDSGEAFLRDPSSAALVKVSGKRAMELAGIERIVLGPKEGLALNAPIAFSTALLALAVVDAENALRTSEIAVAMTLESLNGFRDAFLPVLHEVRGHPGQIQTAGRIYRYLEGSSLVDGDLDADPIKQPPQDAYSLRCVPQVLGAVNDTVSFVKGIVGREINAVQDNPLIFPELPQDRTLKAVSGGNFHGEYVAMAADFLSIAVTELANISERRLFRLDESTLNRHLPDMLIDSELVGLDCGFMIPQYVAAALVSECKTLAHPDSVDSIPTCGNQEDHVSMSMNACLHARRVVENAETVVAIELWMAAQALDLRLSGRRVNYPVENVEVHVDERDGAFRFTASAKGPLEVHGEDPPTPIGAENVPAPSGDDVAATGRAFAEIELDGVRLIASRAKVRPGTENDIGTVSRAVLRFLREQETDDGRPITMVVRDTVMYPFIRTIVRLVHRGDFVVLVQQLQT
jgi:histidine ammonia-lyase